jgi:beta-fructofuranosidase
MVEVISVKPRIGHWRTSTDGNQSISATADSGFAWASFHQMSDAGATVLVEATMQFSANTRSVGLILQSDAALEHYYQLRLEPGRQRVVFDRSPRLGDEPPIIERPIHLPADTSTRLQVLLDGSVIVAYVNGEVALSTRGYEHKHGVIGIFVSEGTAAFSDLCVAER